MKYVPVCKWCHKETAPWLMTAHGVCKDCFETAKAIAREVLPPPPQIEQPVEVKEEKIAEEAVEEAKAEE